MFCITYILTLQFYIAPSRIQPSLVNKLFFFLIWLIECSKSTGLNSVSVKLPKSKYSLVDICYCVHPAPNAHLIADIRWVTEFMNYANMVWIRATKYLLLKSQRVNLWNVANRLVNKRNRDVILDSRVDTYQIPQILRQHVQWKEILTAYIIKYMIKWSKTFLVQLFQWIFLSSGICWEISIFWCVSQLQHVSKLS